MKAYDMGTFGNYRVEPVETYYGHWVKTEDFMRLFDMVKDHLECGACGHQGEWTDPECPICGWGFEC